MRKDGSQFWANVVITALRDDDGELRRVRQGDARPDRAPARRGGALRSAQAEEAIRLRDEFLSLVSHELKTPLTVLQIAARYAARRASTTSRTEKVAVKLQTRRARAATGSRSLIDSLLDVSRSRPGGSC